MKTRASDSLCFGSSNVKPVLECDGWVRTQNSDDIAIVSSDGEATYGDVISAVRERAAAFNQAELRGRIVALQRARSRSYVIDLLALLSIGGVPMPIDPELPKARCEQMMRIAQPAAVIENTGNVEIVFEQKVDSAPRLQQDAAYVFFTSGSTGYPKAILGSRKSLRHFIKWQGRQFNVVSSDRVPFLTHIGFDVSLRDILLPLHHGAKLIIPDAKTLESPDLTLEWLRQSGATRIHTVPSIARVWARCKVSPLTSLITVFSAGEKMTPGTLAAIRSLASSEATIVNFYGPTETTLAKFFYSLSPRESIEGVSAPVGYPLPGTSYALGVDGEILISTAHASLGYLGASPIENDRFSTKGGVTTYHTGDLGEITTDGLLRVVGRLDDQVKINGIRLHLKEIEQELSTAPMVDDVVVLAQQFGAENETRLAVVWTGVDAQANALKAYAQTRLPRAVVPTTWQHWDELPRNANGKTDIRKIEKILQEKTSGIVDSSNYSKTESWLCDIVAELLDSGPVSISDNFFALGGTSLQVAFLVGRIAESFGKTLDFAEIFDRPELLSIVAAIESTPRHKVVKIAKVEESMSYSLSPQQRRWWNIYMPFGNRSWATMVRMISFNEILDKSTVQKALFAIVQHQVAMQLSLHQDKSRVVQKRKILHSVDEISVNTYDFSNLSFEEAATSLDQLRLDIANDEIPTDLWPLFRCSLVVMPNDRAVVVFAMHHMISDGFSMGLIESALRTLIAESNIPESLEGFNYLDYAAWANNQEILRFGKGSMAETYWKDLFATPYSKYVFQEKWIGANGDRGRSYCCVVSPSIRAGIQNFAKQAQVTEFSVYFAAKFLAWHEFLGREDLVVGTPAAGRDVSGTESLVGNFISLCCVRSRITDTSTSPADYVREIMRGVVAGMNYQNYQYDTLVSSLGMEFEQDRFPLTTIFISYLNFETTRRTPLNRSELGFSDLGFAVKFDAMSYVREHSDCATLQIQYRNNLFDQEDIRKFSECWLSKLQELVITAP